MDKLRIPYLEGISANEEELKQVFNSLPAHAIAQQPWPQYPYKPTARFKIAYSGEAILLNYLVEEQFIRLNSFASNDPVWEDSCVEFFISFADDRYFNLEFNAIGVSLVGYGSQEKNSRQRLDNTEIDRIQSYSEIRKVMQGEAIEWNLGLYIPLSIFGRENIPSWRGLQCRANFYKCGDLLPNPHFQSWAPIIHPCPNFHLPDFFAPVEFE